MARMLLASRSLLTAAILVLFVASPAAAGTLDLFTFESQVIPGVNNQGWWSATLANDASNDNFFVGREFDNLHHGTSGNILRDYFNFDLSAVTGSVVSATLFLPNHAYNSSDQFETLGLFDVSTDAITLNHHVGTSSAIFDDLGTGKSYGQVTIKCPVCGQPPGLLVGVPLNDAGLADINSAAGGFFSIGGSLLTLSNNDDTEGLFGGITGTFGNSNEGVMRLEVETVPEPSTLLLFSSGVAGIAGLGAATWRRRVRARSAAGKTSCSDYATNISA